MAKGMHMRLGERRRLFEKDTPSEKLDRNTTKLVEVLRLAAGVLTSGRGDNTKHGFNYKYSREGVKIFASKGKIAELAGVFEAATKDPTKYGFPFDPTVVAGRDTNKGTFILSLKG